tara:strand:+ start:693 stop:1154 length:462 start_codon:yes stop_codon:yes gene_type:complete
MNKIVFYFCFLILFGCSGYEPLFSKKNTSFYIESIENVNGDNITKKISRNLNSNKLKSSDKNNYKLKITSTMQDKITSKDSRGNALTNEVSIDVMVNVYNDNSNVPFNTFRISDSFIYNNRQNKFDLNQYKKNILQNALNKVSQDIIIKLETL